MALDNVNLSEGRHPRSALRSCSPSTLCTHRGRRPKRVGRAPAGKARGGTGGRPKLFTEKGKTDKSAYGRQC